MKLHTLKIQAHYFFFVNHGAKRFEIRKDDRNYEIGDIIHFIKVNGEEFAENMANVFRITYILRNTPEYGLQDGYCILGIEQLKGDSIYDSD